ncbi:MAG TPA: electron transfer flavoprotein subunit beta/FixA family protein [bacterium]|nr:electron transfer flavoprotein subunit beta/FixA family protein [bacterium]
MNIAVLIKQVPRTDRIKIDHETGTLIRSGVESILNPYCEYGLDLAVELKKRFADVKITAFTMGPVSSEIVLRRALALGADEAVLLNDKAFAGSDCRATAYTLSRGILAVTGVPDIIICGKQAVDGDTAQVPGEVSSILNIPVLPYVTQVNCIDGYLEVRSEIENELLTLRSELPVLITVGSGSNIRRMPSIDDVSRAFRKKITVLSAKDAGCDSSNIGLKGSPTRVVKIETVVSKGKCRIFNEKNLSEGLDYFSTIIYK